MRIFIHPIPLPILGDFAITTTIFSTALALQTLMSGIGQPFAGALADKFGTSRVLAIGAAFYALSLILMVYSRDPVSFILTQGVMLGLALSSCSFALVLGTFQKMLPAEKRPLAFGLGTASGSFGQFLFSPLAGGMIENIGWQNTAFLFAGIMLIIMPLALSLYNTPGDQIINVATDLPGQTMGQALLEAVKHKSYLLLVIGFFTCGFQLAFITVHFQRYVVEAGLAPSVGYWAFALVGIFNIVGSTASGWFSARIPKRWVLSFIYGSRSLVTLVFIMMEPSAFSVYMFGVLSGLLWLSTVPPTTGLISVMFGSRYFSTLFGLALMSHQVGGFSGLMIAGFLREATGSFAALWWLSIGMGIFSMLINLPIIEKPVRSAPTPQPA